MATAMGLTITDTFTKQSFLQGGYDAKLTCMSASGRYTCPICHHLMRDPIQTTRGEVACAYCYENAKRDNGRCPIDGDLIQPNDIFRDKAKGREIRTLECFCKYEDNGCTWKGMVEYVEDHLETCKFVPYKCHLCEQDVNPSELNTHLEFCKTWAKEKRCIYTGCTYKAKDVADLNDHMGKDAITHSMLYMSTITNLRKQWKLQSEELTNSTQEKSTQMESDIEQLKGQMIELMKYATDMQDNYDAKTKKLEEKINQLEQEKSPADTPDTKVMSDTVRVLQQNIADIDLRQQLFENTSYDGKLLWKINNVSQRMHKAMTGSITALHSAPVFTSKYGYKFCARLYLHGDGIGRGTHASLFFVLMKSEYDGLLEWPFNHQINFRMINQEDNNNDITESFVADQNSSSFVKPTKEMNIASGCPLFVKKESLNNGFIKDDTLYVEVTVS